MAWKTGARSGNVPPLGRKNLPSTRERKVPHVLGEILADSSINISSLSCSVSYEWLRGEGKVSSRPLGSQDRPGVATAPQQMGLRLTAHPDLDLHTTSWKKLCPYPA